MNTERVEIVYVVDVLVHEDCGSLHFYVRLCLGATVHCPLFCRFTQVEPLKSCVVIVSSVQGLQVGVFTVMLSASIL